MFARLAPAADLLEEDHRQHVGEVVADTNAVGCAQPEGLECQLLAVLVRHDDDRRAVGPQRAQQGGAEPDLGAVDDHQIDLAPAATIAAHLDVVHHVDLQLTPEASQRDHGVAAQLAQALRRPIADRLCHGADVRLHHDNADDREIPVHVTCSCNARGVLRWAEAN